MSQAFRVAALQTRPLFGDIAGNVRRALALAAQVTPTADLYVFPELAFSGYAIASRAEARTLAETPDDSAAPGLSALAAWTEARRTHAIVGFPERAPRGRVYNSAALIGPDGRVKDVYRKIHLFDTEKLWATPGDRAPHVTRVGAARVGMLVCYDWRFPEIARVLALAGADVIAHPSNLVVTAFAQQAMRVRALENRVYAVTANRAGADVRPGGTIAFTGCSQVVDVNGVVLAVAGARAPKALVADLDLSRARNKRFTARNDLMRDRRPEFYAEVARPRRGRR